MGDFTIFFSVLNNVFIISLLLVVLAYYSAPPPQKKNHRFVIRPFRSKNSLEMQLVE